MEDKQEKSQEEMVKEADSSQIQSEEEELQEETDAQEEQGTGAEDVREEAGEELQEEADAEEEGGTNGKKLFGRKNKKDKKDEKIEELTDRLTRQMAEFDNFRKRTDKEKSQMYEVGARDVIETILPVIDDFERGFGTVEEEDRNDSFVQGMEMVYKKLMAALENIGVKPIEAVGQEFDPDFHNAVMHVEDESFGENIVAEELQKGYTYRGAVVRYSMVKVAN